MRILLGAALLAFASESPAQPARFEASVGAAFPGRALGKHRKAGPLIGVSALSGDTTAVAKLRLSGEVAWLLQDGPRPDGSSAFGDWRAMSAIVSGVFERRGTGPSPYLLLGLAVHRIDIEGASNPYGTIFGGRIGAGGRARLRRVTVRLEVAAHPILSDFGTSEEFLIGSYRPIGVVVGF